MQQVYGNVYTFQMCLHINICLLVDDSVVDIAIVGCFVVFIVCFPVVDSGNGDADVLVASKVVVGVLSNEGNERSPSQFRVRTALALSTNIMINYY